MWRTRQANGMVPAQGPKATHKSRQKSSTHVASASSRGVTRRRNNLGNVVSEVPGELMAAMRQWGPQLLHRAMHAGAQMPSGTVRVGTDCSGLEAPFLALRAMQVPFHHVLSSGINPRKRKFIEAIFA